MTDRFNAQAPASAFPAAAVAPAVAAVAVAAPAAVAAVVAVAAVAVVAAVVAAAAPKPCEPASSLQQIGGLLQMVVVKLSQSPVTLFSHKVSACARASE